jgi:putative methyltransferase (TIGR04325 family)
VKIPIILFTYARPDHLRRTLACLRDNRVPLIYAFSDGPREPDKVGMVEQVRKILHGIDWCDLVLCKREENWGLGRSILAGVTEVLAEHESCLVFEDDLICVPGTYDYLCAALRHYCDNPRVMSVTGWTHPRVTPENVGDQPYFDGRAESLVWGTWARAWAGMNDRTAEHMMLTAEARGISRNTYGEDLPLMAKTELSRNIWAVRLLYHHIDQGGLCLRPPWSLVEHIGFDALATNAANPGQLANPPLQPCPPMPSDWPVPEEHPDCAHLWRSSEPVGAQISNCFSIVFRVGGRLYRKIRNLALFKRVRTLTTKDIWGQITPPLAMTAVRFLWSRKWLQQYAIGYRGKVGRLRLIGNYANWEDALTDCIGNNMDTLQRKKTDSLVKAKQGEAVYERDSMIFDKNQYAWPLLAGLMWVAARSGGKLNVVDLGCSFGSTWFQNRTFLSGLDVVHWNIIEHPHYADVGQNEFKNDQLRFYSTIEECFKETEPNVILLSGVLQYLEQPYDLLDTLHSLPCEFMIIDRTPFSAGSADRICVQQVPCEGSPASYPSWIFSAQRFRSILSLHWEVVAEFDGIDRLPAPVPISHRGMIARRQPGAGIHRNNYSSRH